MRVLLKFFQQNGRFPESHAEISDIGERQLSALLKVTDDIDLDYDYLGHRDPKHPAHYTRVAPHRFENLWQA